MHIAYSLQRTHAQFKVTLFSAGIVAFVTLVGPDNEALTRDLLCMKYCLKINIAIE